MPYSGLSGHQAYTWPTGPGRCCLTFSTTVLTPQSQGVTLTGYYPKFGESARPEGSQVMGEGMQLTLAVHTPSRPVKSSGRATLRRKQNGVGDTLVNCLPESLTVPS